MKIERKIWLMTGALAVLAVISVPSVFFHEAIKKYFSFLYSWNVASVSSVRTSSLPPTRQMGTSAELPLPELRFVEFKIKIRNAKTVKIAGDFNKWNADKLTLSKRGSAWKTIVTLPSGTYRYLYKVDDKFILDPLNPKTSYYDSRKVSVLTVK